MKCTICEVRAPAAASQYFVSVLVTEQYNTQTDHGFWWPIDEVEESGGDITRVET